MFAVNTESICLISNVGCGKAVLVTAKSIHYLYIEKCAVIATVRVNICQLFQIIIKVTKTQEQKSSFSYVVKKIRSFPLKSGFPSNISAMMQPTDQISTKTEKELISTSVIKTSCL